MAIVVDASALIALLTAKPGAGLVRSEIDTQAAFAPELIDPECLHALRRFERNGQLSELGAERAMRALIATPVLRVRHRDLLRRAWRYRHNVSAYDSMYLALAAGLRCRLITGDRRLVGAPGIDVTLTVLPDV